ncbi:MAG: hypothetical protein Q4E65_06060 [Clostridia bacterium]|nr:hypothetical protein [Clostridia bacterium]
MKKLLAILLSAILVLGIATSAMALSWAAPTTSSGASPFSAEVIKLGASTGVTGYTYYTALNDAAAYDYSNIYYAIKLTLPSAAEANAYYGSSNYSVGDTVKVNITYTNVLNKSSETTYVTLSAKAKTLWYNASSGMFEESWVPSVTNSYGFGDAHIAKATATGAKEVRVKVCFAAKGTLSDIKINGCYGVAKREFNGVKPCVNCAAIDLNGFVFSGDCAKFDIFFATNSAGKVTGAYVIDKASDYTVDTYGSMRKITTTLYGWQLTGTGNGDYNYYYNTGYAGVTAKFTLEPLNAGTLLYNNWQNWDNDFSYGSIDAADAEALFVGSSGVIASTVVNNSNAKQTVTRNAATYDTVYIMNDYGYFVPVSQVSLDKIYDGLAAAYAGTGTYNLYRNAKYTDDATNTTDLTYDSTADTTNVMSLSGTVMPYSRNNNRFIGKAWSKYQNTGRNYYLDTYVFLFTGTDEQLFQQLAVSTVSCDTTDGAYLNALNYLYSVLGFGYADIAAGNVYMTEDILLSNFGFLTAPCAEAVWGAYTASITVTPVAEIPATGSATFMGFVFIGLAAVATIANRKRSRAK